MHQGMPSRPCFVSLHTNAQARANGQGGVQKLLMVLASLSGMALRRPKLSSLYTVAISTLRCLVLWDVVSRLAELLPLSRSCCMLLNETPAPSWMMHVKCVYVYALDIEIQQEETAKTNPIVIVYEREQSCSADAHTEGWSSSNFAGGDPIPPADVMILRRQNFRGGRG